MPANGRWDLMHRLKG